MAVISFVRLAPGFNSLESSIFFHSYGEIITVKKWMVDYMRNQSYNTGTGLVVTARDSLLIPGGRGFEFYRCVNWMDAVMIDSHPLTCLTLNKNNNSAGLNPTNIRSPKILGFLSRKYFFVIEVTLLALN